MNLFRVLFLLNIWHFILDKKPEIDIITCTRDEVNGKICICDIPDGYDGFAECQSEIGTPNPTLFLLEPPISLPNTIKSNSYLVLKNKWVSQKNYILLNQLLIFL